MMSKFKNILKGDTFFSLLFVGRLNEHYVESRIAEHLDQGSCPQKGKRLAEFKGFFCKALFNMKIPPPKFLLNPNNRMICCESWLCDCRIKSMLGSRLDNGGRRGLGVTFKVPRLPAMTHPKGPSAKAQPKGESNPP